MGSGQRPRSARLQRGRGRTAAGPADPGGGRHRLHDPGAAGRRRGHRPVELPDADRRLGPRPGPRGGQRRPPQARRDDPADRSAAGRTRPGGRPSRGALPGAARRGPGGRERAGRAPGRREDRVHRLHPDREAHHDPLRRAREAAHPGAGRQEPQRRLRRRRCGGRGGSRPDVLPGQRRPGLLRPDPDPGRAVRVRPVPRRPRPGRVRRGGGRPGRREDADGAADLGRPAGPGPGARRRWPGGRRRTGDARQGSRGARVLVSADRPRRGRARRSGGRRGGLRAGGRGAAVRGRGGRGAAGRRHRLRARRLGLDPGRGPRTAREPEAAGGQPVRQLALQRALFDPFGGYKQSGLGRELGPDALAAFTETKNVFISTEA